MECIICKSSGLTSVIEIDNAPQNIQSLLNKEDFKNDLTSTINLMQCNNCGHFQLNRKDYPIDNYYEDYVMTTSLLTKHKEYDQWFGNFLIEKYFMENKRILDLGCGDGCFVEKMVEIGIDGFGIEPSKPFYNMAIKKNIEVKNYYLTKDAPIKEKSLDGFISRQVFEHLKNPTEVLMSMHKFLKPGAIGIIEVPSFEKSIIDLRHYDIFRDHIAYYTKETLKKLVEICEYEFIEIMDTFSSEYLVIVFRKKLNTELFVSSFEVNRRHFLKELERLKGRNIVVWGAGGKGNALLSMYGITDKHVLAVIDSDENKIGKYTVGSHIEVKSPEYIQNNDINVVIISALAYKDEIYNSLINDYNFSGDIYEISPKLTKYISKSISS